VGSYSFASKFVRLKRRELCLLNYYWDSMCLTRTPLFAVFVPNTLYLLYNLIPFFKLHIVALKAPSVYWSTNEKPSMLLALLCSQHLRALPTKPFHLLLPVLRSLKGFPSIFILHAAFPLHKVPNLRHILILSPNLSQIRDDLPLDDPLYFEFQVSLNIFAIPW